MTNLGYPSKVTEAWVKGKAWFRVQHGEYKMIAVAKQVSTKLKNKYKSKWVFKEFFDPGHMMECGIGILFKK